MTEPTEAGEGGNLPERLREHKEATLAFMQDFAIPFDNYRAKPDTWMTKVWREVSGCLRSMTGAAKFCGIRGYISMLLNQGVPVFPALRLNNPALPLMHARLV